MSKLHSQKEKGQSLVELASVFLLLMLLLVGIVDLGSMFYTYTALRDTSQEGVIFGASNPTDTAGITSRIQKSARWPITPSNIVSITVLCNGHTCLASNTDSCQGKKITVDITYNYQVIMPLIPTIINRNTVTLTANVTETILQSKATLEALGSDHACDEPYPYP